MNSVLPFKRPDAPRGKQGEVKIKILSDGTFAIERSGSKDPETTQRLIEAAAALNAQLISRSINSRSGTGERIGSHGGVQQRLRLSKGVERNADKTPPQHPVERHVSTTVLANRDGQFSKHIRHKPPTPSVNDGTTQLVRSPFVCLCAGAVRRNNAIAMP
jgi:hypothetical protein